MTAMPNTPMVPFQQANPETQADFIRGLRDLRGLNGNPKAWRCTRCSETIPGDTILISYNVPTPIPFCSTSTCMTYGPELEPAAS